MKVEDYLTLGKEFHESGYVTDGCSFIGFLVPEKYTPACWAHDYARRDLFPEVNTQSENDNLFRNALRHLGMGKIPSSLMYYFTKAQGWFQDNWNLRVWGFIGLLFFVSFVGISFYYGVLHG
jgi:hypothetical protein